MKELSIVEPKEAQEFREFLSKYIIGQAEAIDAVVRQYMRYLSGLDDADRPAASVLLLGPTGVGKTELAYRSAEYLSGKGRSLIAIDCGEFQYGHEIAKLVGSPPGYLGHRETQPLLTQALLDERSGSKGINVLLFDEIEKGHSSIRNLLLGVLDKAKLSTGTNDTINFARSFIFMTSNLGYALQGTKEPGFVRSAQRFRRMSKDEILFAMKREFAPEFINRVDEVIVANYLSPERAREILHLQIEYLAARVQAKHSVILQWSSALEDLLIQQGYTEQYGARDVRKVLQSMLAEKLGAALVNGIEPNEDNERVISATAKEGKVVLLA